MGLVVMREFREWKKKPSQLKLRYLDRFVVGKKVLDIGCGMGFYSEYLANKGFDVTAIDTEKQFVPKRSKFELASANDLPFEDEAFDTVLRFDILEHVEDEKRVLREVKRVCRERLICSVPNRDDEFLSRYNLTFKHHKDKTHRREYTQREIGGLLRKFGFHVEHGALEGEVSPFVLASFLRPPRSHVCLGLIFALKKLRLFKSLPKADIYVVGDRKG